MTVPSPCISQCGLNPSGVCYGCGRTSGEIAAWYRMTDAQRRKVVIEAKQRNRSNLPTTPVRQSPKTAFTLVEPLVAIAIVGCLIGMLLAAGRKEGNPFQSRPCEQCWVSPQPL
ncbi:MAG: DUF1289 domain-containing protein [Planctomycetota bacterium]